MSWPDAFSNEWWKIHSLGVGAVPLTQELAGMQSMPANFTLHFVEESSTPPLQS